jgi:hypothetical protein
MDPATKAKLLKLVKAMDRHSVSREAYRELSKIDENMEREYKGRLKNLFPVFCLK